jgi:hypothetical protein
MSRKKKDTIIDVKTSFAQELHSIMVVFVISREGETDRKKRRSVTLSARVSARETYVSLQFTRSFWSVKMDSNVCSSKSVGICSDEMSVPICSAQTSSDPFELYGSHNFSLLKC